MERISAVFTMLIIGSALLAVAAPQATADCHTEPPLAQLECVYNDVDHAKEAHADALSGEAYVYLAGQTECDDGRIVDWADWASEHDASCIPVTHTGTSSHGSTESSAFPEDVHVEARVLAGRLLLDDELAAVCVPALSVGDHVCTNSASAPAAAQCVTFRAVSMRNTGTELEASLSGPWTHC